MLRKPEMLKKYLLDAEKNPLLMLKKPRLLEKHLLNAEKVPDMEKYLLKAGKTPSLNSIILKAATTPSSMRSNGSPVVSKVGEVSLRRLALSVGNHGSRFSNIRHWRERISYLSLSNVRSHVILLENGDAITSLITGKEVSLADLHSLMSEPLIVVINDPTSLASTQVEYIPHPCSRSPMTDSKKHKSR